MRKMIAAVSVGLLLVAGQAAAAGGNTAGALVTDRVGASADAQEEGTFDIINGRVAIYTVMAGTVVAAWYATDDGECLSGC